MVLPAYTLRKLPERIFPEGGRTGVADVADDQAGRNTWEDDRYESAPVDATPILEVCQASFGSPAVGGDGRALVDGDVSRHHDPGRHELRLVAVGDRPGERGDGRGRDRFRHPG